MRVVPKKRKRERKRERKLAEFITVENHPPPSQSLHLALLLAAAAVVEMATGSDSLVGRFDHVPCGHTGRRRMLQPTNQPPKRNGRS
jgi:hypothetical protein